MSGLALVYAVFADREEAKAIATAMVGRRLAACVNVLAPCQSYYRWEDILNTAEEVPALFKTTTDKIEPLIAAIAGMHGYDTPAISAWPVTHAWPDYAGWVRDETTEAP